MCKIVLLDFAHYRTYKIVKLQRFEGWILLPSAGEKGKWDRKPAGPLDKLSSDLDSSNSFLDIVIL
jgi:hypothetical protein